MLDRLVVILTSPETAQLLGRSGVRAYDALVQQDTESLWRFIDREVPLNDILEALPDQCLHVLKRDDIRQGILDEVAQTLDEIGSAPVRSLFADDEQVLAWTADLVEQAVPILNRFAKSKALKTRLAP